MTEYDRQCDYCHTNVSIFEGLTEFGKWLHEQCYIHRTQKEIEGYKKKWINKKLSSGDKSDIIDKYNLVQKLMTERTEFKGLLLKAELNLKRHALTSEPEKRILYLDNNGCIPVFDENGFPVFIIDDSPTIEMRLAVMRPVVERHKTGFKPKLLTVADVPLLMENLP